jgi:hypothetical protein
MRLLAACISIGLSLVACGQGTGAGVPPDGAPGILDLGAGGDGITGGGIDSPGGPATDAGFDASMRDTGTGGGPDAVAGDDAGIPTDSIAGNDTGGGDPCGGCPTGFSCGPADYCMSSTGVPLFGHVYLIVMENHSLASILGNSDAPYLNGLMNDWVYASNYVTRIGNPIHPSLPNYITITSSDPQGIGCDCSPTANASTSAHLSCNSSFMDSSCPLSVTDHIGNSLDAAGVEWREYGEDMGTACNVTDSGNYVARHIPLLYYVDVQTDTARCNDRVRDFGDFASDLGDGTYRFSMISPNLCNDMHGNNPVSFLDTCGGKSAVNNGDNWLAAQVPNILATPGFSPGGSDVLFIVWDEEDGSTGSEPIPLIIVSPLLAAGTPTGTSYDHASLLATITDGLGAGRVGMASGPINDVWQ